MRSVLRYHPHKKCAGEIVFGVQRVRVMYVCHFIEVFFSILVASKKPITQTVPTARPRFVRLERLRTLLTRREPFLSNMIRSCHFKKVVIKIRLSWDGRMYSIQWI